MLKVILISLIILLFCMAFLSIKIIVKKNGKFPNSHVGGSSYLRKKGIFCAQTQDHEAKLQKNIFELIQDKNE